MYEIRYNCSLSVLFLQEKNNTSSPSLAAHSSPSRPGLAIAWFICDFPILRLADSEKKGDNELTIITGVNIGLGENLFSVREGIFH